MALLSFMVAYSSLRIVGLYYMKLYEKPTQNRRLTFAPVLRRNLPKKKDGGWVPSDMEP